MPIFEFHCEKCNKDFECLVMGKEQPACPHCKGKKVRKLLSSFSHSSGGKFASSAGAACGSCSSTNCGP